MEDKYIMKRIQLFEEFIVEANKGKVHKAAKQGSYPAVIVVVQDGKVIHQEPVSTPDVAPATFNVMQEKYPKALIHLEDKTGKRLFTESVVYNSSNTKPEAAKQATKEFGKLLPKANKGVEPYVFAVIKTKARNYRLAIKSGSYVAHEFMSGLQQDGILTSDIVKKAVTNVIKLNPEEFNESVVTEGKFDNIADLTKALHFETDEKTAEEMKMELGKKQGEVSKRKQIEIAEYSLRRFRKSINFGDGTYLGVFIPGSYDASTSVLGDGPHKKAAKKIRWTQKKYDQWLEDMASNGGAENAFDMAQNAKNEPGLIDWVKKEFRGDDPMQRIQWDIEGAL